MQRGGGMRPAGRQLCHGTMVTQRHLPISTDGRPALSRATRP